MVVLILGYALTQRPCHVSKWLEFHNFKIFIFSLQVQHYRYFTNFWTTSADNGRWLEIRAQSTTPFLWTFGDIVCLFDNRRGHWKPTCDFGMYLFIGSIFHCDRMALVGYQFTYRFLIFCYLHKTKIKELKI